MGELFALASAVVWAFAVILLRRSGETISPFALNLFRVGISCLLFVLLLPALGLPLLGDLAPGDLALLALSAAVGIALSDTLFHSCLNLVGAGITAIVDCLYSPLTALFGFWMLAERLGPAQFAGMALVIIKPVLGHAPLLQVVTVRQLCALACLLPVTLLSGSRRRVLGVFRPSRSWRFMLPGAFLGSFLALVLWVAGMKYSLVGVAAALNQTSTIFIILLATLFLKEPFTRRRLAATGLAVGGIALVMLG
jgi:drug/metabolite transporter (DMT)-like permease